jgi:2-aminobenzoate-CoA ligase
MAASAHIDTFARDNLPPRELMPEFRFTLPELQYPERINCAVEFVDRLVEQGLGARPAIVSPSETWSYTELLERVNRIANVLVHDLGMQPGNRVLLRGPNGPMMAAAFLAVVKAGGVAINTMPLLRAREIAYPLTKAKVALALCDIRLADEMKKAAALAPGLERVVYWGEPGPQSLEALMAKPGYEHFVGCETASDDVCLIGFTSGTTGEPKGTMHFHRDLLAICDSYGKYVLRAEPEDRFIGSPPLAFTFGLGGLLLFPLRVGAAAILLEKAPPDELIAPSRNIARPSVSPRPPPIAPCSRNSAGTTFHRCANAYRPASRLPKATWDSWFEATGIRTLDGIGATKCCTSSSARPRRSAAGIDRASRSRL